MLQKVLQSLSKKGTMETFGEWLRGQRAARKLTREEFANWPSGEVLLSTGTAYSFQSPHPVVYSTKTGKGHGFGPKEGEIAFPRVPVPGQITEEALFDPSGQPKKKYECSIRSTSECV